MATLRSRCGHYIFVLWFLPSIFLLLFIITMSWMTAGKSVEEIRGHVLPVGLSTAPNPNYVTQISTIDMLPVSLSWTHVIADVRSCF